MKKLSSAVFVALLTLCILLHSPTAKADDFSPEAVKQMEELMYIFSSNENLFNFTTVELMKKENRDKLINFVIIHNYNDNKKTIEDDGSQVLYIDGKHVKETIKKLFDYDIKKLSSVEGYKFDGEKYTLGHSDQGMPAELKIITAKKLADGNVKIKGILYENDEFIKPLTVFTAIAKPHEYAGKKTWAILSISSKDVNDMNDE